MSDTIPQKRCPQCPEGQQWHPATTEFFYPHKSRSDGLTSQCKKCMSAYKKAHYQVPEIHDRMLAYSNARYQIPEVRAHMKKRERNLDVEKKWRKVYLKRPEVHARRVVNRRHRRALQKAVAGIHTSAQIQDLLKRQKGKCYYCFAEFEKIKGKYVYHVDHTFPISRVAGTGIPANDISYLVLACPDCNHKKNNRFPWEWPEGGRLF